MTLPSRPRREIFKYTLGIACGLSLISAAYIMTGSDLSERQKRKEKEEFLEKNIDPLLTEEQRANSKAIQAAEDQFEQIFARYKSGIPGFAEELTTWSFKYNITKQMIKKVIGKPDYSEAIIHNLFSSNVVSDVQLETDITRITAQLASDLHANENAMLVAASALIGSSSLGFPDMARQRLEFQEKFRQLTIQQLSASAKKAPLVSAVSFAGGIIVEESARRLVQQLIAGATTRMVVSAATTGGATAAGAGTGAAAGTAAAPGLGTAIGVVTGFIIGAVADWWMEERFKEKLIGESNEKLDIFRKALWDDPDNGLKPHLDRAVSSTRESHYRSMRKILLGT